MSGQDLAVVIGASCSGLAVLIASIVSAYNSIRANKQSGATHDIVTSNTPPNGNPVTK